MSNQCNLRTYVSLEHSNFHKTWFIKTLLNNYLKNAKIILLKYFNFKLLTIITLFIEIYYSLNYLIATFSGNKYNRQFSHYFKAHFMNFNFICSITKNIKS